MSKLYNYFKEVNKHAKFGHAFLIGNTCYQECKNDLEKVISDFLFDARIDIDNNPDIYVIEPDGNNITKSQIKELLNNISTTSQMFGKKVYVITGCEKLSDSVYNSLLKTIEEPEDNIYAFLITSNIDAVVETIKSRCQIVFVSSNVDFETNKEDYDRAVEIIKKIEKNKLKAIGKNNELYTMIRDREDFKKIILEIFSIYRKILYNKVNYENNVHLNGLCDDESKIICKKVITINNLIEKNNININKDLLIDKLIIDLWRCDETSFNRI